MPDSAESSLPKRRQILDGVKDTLGIGIAIFPLGMALGILVAQSGLPWWLLPALSFGIFAGSVELLMVSMLAAATPIIAVAVAVFAVNFRHVFYAFSFPMSHVRRGLPRAYSTYALIDEAYVIYSLLAQSAPERLSSARIVTGQAMMQFYWVAGGFIGLGIAAALPAPIQGFEFALTATFIVMALDAIRSRRELPSAVLAGLAVTVAIVAFPTNAMLAALVIFIVLLAARYAIGARGRKADPPLDEPGEESGRL